METTTKVRIVRPASSGGPLVPAQNLRPFGSRLASKEHPAVRSNHHEWSARNLHKWPFWQAAYAIDLVEFVRETYVGQNMDGLLRGFWWRSKRTATFCKLSRSAQAAVPAR